jgi:activating signal cointegrator 1
MQTDLLPNPTTRPLLAISLWEPWASAMALGLKENETRDWPTHYRGPLVICAAKRKMTRDDLDTYDALVKPEEAYTIPYGCAVCVIEVYDCIPTRLYHGATPLPISQLESALGNYTTGRFAWRTRNLRRLATPIPVAGKQGFFHLPPAAAEQVRGQLTPNS